MESNFIYKDVFRKKSKLTINSLKIPTYETFFKNETTGKVFKFNNVKILKYNRNKIINHFFDTYIDSKKFSLIEFGIPYIVTERIERITQKIKRRCLSNGYKVLGFVWIFDVGEENFGAHYHLVVAIKKYSKREYPDFLKIEFKKQIIHGAFVRNRNAFRRYLLGKKIYEKGKRKRIYGNSRRFNLSKNHLKQNETI